MEERRLATWKTGKITARTKRGRNLLEVPREAVEQQPALPGERLKCVAGCAKYDD